MISAAFAAAATTNTPNTCQVIRHIHSSVSETISGQSADLSKRMNKPISEDEYLQIVARKTAPLLSLPVELAFIHAGKSEFLALLKPCITAYSIAYQIFDDISDTEIDHIEGNLNIVNMLSRELSYYLAVQKATRLAEESLNKFNLLADKIPFGCGEILKQLPSNMDNAIFTPNIETMKPRHVHA